VDAVATGFYRWQGRGPAAGTSGPRCGLTCGSSVSRPALTHTGPVGSAKQLICPTCGNVIADAQHRRWQARVVVTSVDGERVRPTSIGLLMALARQRGEQDRLDWLQVHAEELVLDLICPRGHTVLTAVPDLVRTMRTTPGRWVTPPGPLGPNRPPGGPA